MTKYEKMNAIYATYFKTNHPVRTTIQATPPGNMQIEIDAIAYSKRPD